MISWTVTSLPVATLVAVATTVAMVMILLLCACKKQSSESKDEDDAVNATSPSSVLISPEHANKGDFSHVNGVQADVENGVTPLNTSLTSQNGHAHSRGNSVDLTKADRRSGASTGSSPRPHTLSRELPDIPVNNNSNHNNRGNHSHQNETFTPSHGRVSTSTLESPCSRGTIHSTHLHTQLPEIPKGAQSPLTSNRSPEMRNSPRLSRPPLNESEVTLRPLPLKDKPSGLDDYDHIEEATKRKTRPRSDYDHVVLEGGKECVILSKDKLNENDYAEVKSEKFDTLTEEVTVIPVDHSTSKSSASKSPRQSRPNPVHKSNSIDDPYNKIKGDDPPYNRIKEETSYNKFKSDDPPYNKIKDDPYNKIKVDDPYNTVIQDDDPYNKVKVDNELDVDDLDPYDDLNDGSSSRRKKRESFKIAVTDPYSFVTDEERNVSNQTDPYARMGDTESEIDDPYNKVIDDPVAVGDILPEYGEDDYATVNKVSEITEVEYAKVNKQGAKSNTANSGAASLLNPNSRDLDRAKAPSPREEIFQDADYSTVIKVKKISTGATGSEPGQTGSKRQSEGQRSIFSGVTIQGHLPGHGSVECSRNRQNGSTDSLQRQEGSNRGLRKTPNGSTDSLQAQESRSGANSKLNSSHDDIRSYPTRRSGDSSGLVTPPEPPRAYIDDVDEGSLVRAVAASAAGVAGVGNVVINGDDVGDDDLGAESDHYNTVNLERTNSRNTSDGKKEPPYNKLSVRESLASMNARAASNTYEYVSEVDNLYATVDGSSGDGVVRPKVTTGSAAPAPARESQTYAEIDAPAPPSLDSLHETAKQHQDEIRRKTDNKIDYYNLDKNNLKKGQGSPGSPLVQGHLKGHRRTPSDHTQFKSQSSDTGASYDGRVMSSSMEGRIMSTSFEGRVPIATQENDDLDFEPSYQAGHSEKSSDSTSEFDPNYETVEEAKSKVKYEEINGAGARPKKIRPHIYAIPDDKRKYEIVKDGETVTEDGKIRAHVYEEVTVTNEARRLRQKVLSQHTYEEVTEVKEQGQGDGKNDKTKPNTKSEGHKKKKDKEKEKSHSRNSSGDWMFGKKKSGDDKHDKGKDGKKKDKK